MTPCSLAGKNLTPNINRDCVLKQDVTGHLRALFNCPLWDSPPSPLPKKKTNVMVFSEQKNTVRLLNLNPIQYNRQVKGTFFCNFTKLILSYQLETCLKQNYIILSQEIPGFPDKKNFQKILLKTHHSTTTSLAWPEFTCRSRFFGVTGNGQLPLAADISLNISPSCGTCRPTEWWCISQNQSWVYMEMPRIRSCWLIFLIFSKVPVFQNGQGPAKARGKSRSKQTASLKTSLHFGRTNIVPKNIIRIPQRRTNKWCTWTPWIFIPSALNHAYTIYYTSYTH